MQEEISSTQTPDAAKASHVRLLDLIEDELMHPDGLDELCSSGRAIIADLKERAPDRLKSIGSHLPENACFSDVLATAVFLCPSRIKQVPVCGWPADLVLVVRAVRPRVPRERAS